ncbi:hypothetical protein [Nostoc sp. TCL240-02]|uniref:hypothetical protein n=1 Tax=Nostoc sp. TCL240-02 TaxID=2572090 RepID=UPI00157F9C75|nr:hypothetical protein [Nostoc sp. TCL240-02]
MGVGENKVFIVIVATDIATVMAELPTDYAKHGNVNAEPPTDYAKHGNVNAEPPTDYAKYGNVNAEPPTDYAKYGNVNAELPTDYAKYGNVNAESPTAKTEVATVIVSCRNSFLTGLLNKKYPTIHSQQLKVISQQLQVVVFIFWSCLNLI